MNETVLVGLISGVVALVVGYLAQRNTPSRKVADTATIVTASGHVIGTLRQEIDRLDTELLQARTALMERPTKAELFEVNGKLRRQLLEEGITPINGPINPQPDLGKG